MKTFDTTCPKCNGPGPGSRRLCKRCHQRQKKELKTHCNQPGGCPPEPDYSHSPARATSCSTVHKLGRIARPERPT